MALYCHLVGLSGFLQLMYDKVFFNCDMTDVVRMKYMQYLLLHHDLFEFRSLFFFHTKILSSLFSKKNKARQYAQKSVDTGGRCIYSSPVPLVISF